MTLCVAWIREKSKPEELIFATDSVLTGGEKWSQGVKLFELPRPDCLICFAGSTFRAYPLILNLVSSIKFDKRLQNPHTDISEVIEYLSTLFTSLVYTIKKEVTDELTIHDLRSDAKFLFGGWSWIQNRFRIWKLFYSEDAEGFVYNEVTDAPTKTRSYIFLGDPDGDPIDVEEIASRKFKQYLFDNDKQDEKLDMEPLKILIEMSRDSQTQYIERFVDGAIQIAKVYKSGILEFFGVYWQSIDGKPYFQGREFEYHDKPEVRYFDPDTLEIVEDQLPILIKDMTPIEHFREIDFIRQCYDDEGSLKLDLPVNFRERLISIFQKTSYSNFMREINDRNDSS